MPYQTNHNTSSLVFYMAAKKQTLSLPLIPVHKNSKMPLLASPRLSCLCVSLSVHPFEWNISALTGQIFMKIDTWKFFKNYQDKIDFHLNLTRITVNLHKDLSTFMIIYCWILLRMTNFSDRFVAKIKLIFIFGVQYSFSENYVILWDKVEEYFTV